MATSQYYAWVADNRPITPARPIRDVVERMRIAYPQGANAHIFSWYADNAHYQSNNPQDHTPYSYTPWPINPNPYPVVFATDIMHRPDLGVDCFKLFDYWIIEARAGRMPWLKYMIWQGRSYDVRTGWVPKTASGHYDHIHLSARTDFQNTGLGTWVLVPGTATGGDDMYCSLAATTFNENALAMQYQINDAGVVVDADGKYGNRTARALTLATGLSNATAVIDGVTVPIQNVYKAKEFAALQRAVAVKAAKDNAGTGSGSEFTEEQIRGFAEEEAEEAISEAVVTTEVTTTIKPGE